MSVMEYTVGQVILANLDIVLDLLSSAALPQGLTRDKKAERINFIIDFDEDRRKYRTVISFGENPRATGIYFVFDYQLDQDIDEHQSYDTENTSQVITNMTSDFQRKLYDQFMKVDLRYCDRQVKDDYESLVNRLR